MDKTAKFANLEERMGRTFPGNIMLLESLREAFSTGVRSASNSLLKKIDSGLLEMKSEDSLDTVKKYAYSEVGKGIDEVKSSLGEFSFPVVGLSLDVAFDEGVKSVDLWLSSCLEENKASLKYSALHG